MNCTHGGPAMNITIGATCPWCLQIVAEPARLATAAGVGAGSVDAALEVPAPAATFAVGSLDATRLDETDLGPAIAAFEGHPDRLFDSGTPTALFAANPVTPLARATAAASEVSSRTSGASIASEPAAPHAKDPTQKGSAADPLHADGDDATVRPGRHLHQPASHEGVDGSVGQDHGSVCGEAKPAPETIPSPVVSGAPIARNTDPQPAHEAAARARHDYTFDQWLVLAAHVASRDLNGDELGKLCGRPYQSVGPRRPALERNGLIEETGTRRGGKGCYRVTDAGRAAWRNCPESMRPTVLAQLANTAVMALRGAA